MRGTRWLLLVAIAAILGGIGLTYRAQKQVLLAEAPPKPAPLPSELSSSSEGYHWVQRDTQNGNRVVFDMFAKDAKQRNDAPRVDLTGVEIKMPGKTGATYSLVKSSAASFFTSDHHVYSEGDVEITLNVPFEGQPKHAPVSIKSSGVTCDSATGHAETDRPSSFSFER